MTGQAQQRGPVRKPAGRSAGRGLSLLRLRACRRRRVAAHVPNKVAGLGVAAHEAPELRVVVGHGRVRRHFQGVCGALEGHGRLERPEVGHSLHRQARDFLAHLHHQEVRLWPNGRQGLQDSPRPGHEPEAARRLLAQGWRHRTQDGLSEQAVEIGVVQPKRHDVTGAGRQQVAPLGVALGRGFHLPQLGVVVLGPDLANRCANCLGEVRERGPRGGPVHEGRAHRARGMGAHAERNLGEALDRPGVHELVLHRVGGAAFPRRVHSEPHEGCEGALLRAAGKLVVVDHGDRHIRLFGVGALRRGVGKHHNWVARASDGFEGALGSRVAGPRVDALLPGSCLDQSVRLGAPARSAGRCVGSGIVRHAVGDWRGLAPDPDRTDSRSCLGAEAHHTLEDAPRQRARRELQQVAADEVLQDVVDEDAAVPPGTQRVPLLAHRGEEKALPPSSELGVVCGGLPVLGRGRAVQLQVEEWRAREGHVERFLAEVGLFERLVANLEAGSVSASGAGKLADHARVAVSQGRVRVEGEVARNGSRTQCPKEAIPPSGAHVQDRGGPEKLVHGLCCLGLEHVAARHLCEESVPERKLGDLPVLAQGSSHRAARYRRGAPQLGGAVGLVSPARAHAHVLREEVGHRRKPLVSRLVRRKHDEAACKPSQLARVRMHLSRKQVGLRASGGCCGLGAWHGCCCLL
mmetsp:Transcript_8433/g.33320  ORF Transcript_8433/g.33320 Transcript_8433/m.33320 type:complete len:690 (+) Transcript_8433:989-3058(+)